jgi:hypothetical protein
MRQVPAFDTGPLGIVGTAASLAISSTTSIFPAFTSAHGRDARPPRARRKHSPPAASSSSSIRSLTGPLSRGDAETIDANLKALDGDPFHAIHHAFARLHEQRS